VTLRASDDAEVISLIFENDDMDRISDFELKLMDIDEDHLDVPEDCEAYPTRFSMPSSEFSRIIRDLTPMGESVFIEVSKKLCQVFGQW
jgi:proliferating cell nuclear antigen